MSAKWGTRTEEGISGFKPCSEVICIEFVLESRGAVGPVGYQALMSEYQQINKMSPWIWFSYLN